MESQDEFTEFNDQSTLIIKGKRTKRGRPCSPSGVAAAETSSSSAGGYFSVLSPMSSGEISTTTDEDEDMANCLILLARGVNSIPNRPETEAQKFTSRRLAGFDDYECKTCNRRFPSFQALGGHRASHRKPKGLLPLIQKPSHEDDEPVAAKFAKVSHSPSPFQTAINKPKVHECSICGSEFSSGQALGGHMRRHRALPQTTDSRNILSLDLNLPAPLEDDNHGDEGSNFHYLPPSTAEHMVFSAAALVDCHY